MMRLFKWCASVIVFAVFMSGCAAGRVNNANRIENWQWKGKQFVTVPANQKLFAASSVLENSKEGKWITRVTDMRDVEINRLDVSPDGEKIVFECLDKTDKTAKMKIYVINAKTGDGLIEIGKSNAVNCNPVFSKDGKEIIFSSDRTGLPKLWIAASDGKRGALRQLTAGESVDMDPEVSPDGKRVAYSSLLPDTKQQVICIINYDGSEPTYLRPGRSPRFSPDGKRIMFVNAGGTEGEESDNKFLQLWSMNLDGGALTQITSAEADCFSPSWATDMQKIVYASNRAMDVDYEEASKAGSDLNLWIVEAVSNRTNYLTSNASADTSPVWSPDGKTIYFCSNRGRQWNIWKISLKEASFVLAPPEKLAARAEDGKVVLSWEPSAQDKAVNYYVYFKPVGKKTYWKATDEPVKEAGFEALNLQNGVSYDFAVSAYHKNLMIESERSGIVSAVPSVQDLPSAPDKVRVDDEKETISIKWERGGNASGYNLYFSPDDRKPYWKLNDKLIKGVSFTPDVLKWAEKKYSFRVTSVNARGVESDMSAPVEYAVTGAAPAEVPAAPNKKW